MIVLALSLVKSSQSSPHSRHLQKRLACFEGPYLYLAKRELMNGSITSRAGGPISSSGVPGVHEEGAKRDPNAPHNRGSKRGVAVF